MNKIVLIAIIVLVVLIAIIVAVPLILGHGVSSGGSYITPSEAASVIGGTWSIEEDQSFYFTVNGNNAVTIKYFNGTTETKPLSALLSSSNMFGSSYIPTSGMVESLEGTVNNESSSIDALSLTFSSSTAAKDFYSNIQAESMFFATQTQNVSSNVFVFYGPGGNFGQEYLSGIIELNGNTVYVVVVTAPMPLGSATLENLVSYM
mgnify:CR=1 FL=1